MSRRGYTAKRDLLPDAKHGSELLTAFINVLMLEGKKSIAERIVYGALDEAVLVLKKDIDSRSTQVQAQTQAQASDDPGVGSFSQAQASDALVLFEQVLEHVRPSVEVRSRRVGGATYQVPVEVKRKRAVALAMRWLVHAARQRKKKGMMKRLSAEFIDAYRKHGGAYSKKEETHRSAKANQAFAHFRLSH